MHAEILAEPSAEQRFWVRNFPSLFAPAWSSSTSGRVNELELSSFWVRWYYIVTVAPFANVTNFSLHYQSYLNDIFHTSWISRVGHGVAMPVIVVCESAALCALGGEWAAMFFQLVLTLWWLFMGCC